MKKLLTIAIAASFATTAFHAKAEVPQSGLYLSGSLGFGFTGSNEEFYNSESALGAAVGLPANLAAGIERDFGMSPIVRGAIGYDFNNSFRAEAELSHIRSKASADELTIYDLSTGSSISPGATIIPLDDSISRTALMGNLYYDFNSGQKLQPFVMAGIGVAQTSATQKYGSLDASSPIDLGQSSTGLAVQVGAGAAYSISDTMKLTGEYRLINYNIDTKAGDNGLNSIDHQFTVGLMKYF